MYLDSKQKNLSFKTRIRHLSLLQGFFWSLAVISFALVSLFPVFLQKQIILVLVSLAFIWFLGMGCLVFSTFRLLAFAESCQQVIQKLHNTERYYQEIFNQAYDGIILSNHKGKIVEWNIGAEQITGFSRADVIGRPVWEVQARININGNSGPQTLQQYEDIYLNGISNGNSKWLNNLHDYSIKRADGEIRAVQQVFFPLKVLGSPYIGSIVRDVTEKIEVENQLRKSEERYRLLYEQMPLGYQSLNERGVLVHVNDVWLKELGYSREEIIGRPFTDFLDISSRNEFSRIFPQYRKSGHVNDVEYTMLKKDGKTIIVRVDGRVRYDAQGNFVQTHCVLQNITKQKRLENELNLLAITDSLTGLYNRRYFFELAEKEFNRTLRHNHSLSILMFDIDYFKRINDTYGHLVGDQVLVQIAKSCRETLRDFDIIGRYGGEEFVVMMPQTDGDSAWLVAERLRQRLMKMRFNTTRGNINLSVSVGVAEILDSDSVIEHLLDRADQALYIAKQNGRNQTCLWAG